MNIDFIQNVYVMVGGWWVFLWFIVFTLAIAVLSITMVQTIENMAARTKRIKPIFYTAILLAFATSVPELMTGIDSSLLTNPQPIFAYFDNSGSNFMNLFTVSIFALSFAFYFDKKIMLSIKEHKMTKLKIVINANRIRYKNNLVARTFDTRNKDNVAIIWILVALNVLIVIASYVLPFSNAIIPGLEISAISIIPIGVWVIFLIYLLSRKSNKDEKPDVNKDGFWYKIPKPLLFLSFLVIISALLVVSIVDADLVQSFSDTYHIDDVISGGLIMAVATGLPEFVSNFYLFKRQRFNMVLESIVGSLWMNMLLMFFVDVCFRQDGLFHYANQMIALHNELAPYGGINHAPKEVIQNLTNKLVPWEKRPVAGAMKNAVMMGPWNCLSLLMTCFLPVLILKPVGNHRWIGLSLLFLLFLSFVVGFSTISSMYWNY